MALLTLGVSRLEPVHFNNAQLKLIIYMNELNKYLSHLPSGYDAPDGTLIWAANLLLIC